MDPTTVGTLLLNDSLPPDMQIRGKAIDKKELMPILRHVAEKYPERYKEVLKTMNDVGRDAAFTEGVSVSLSGLKKTDKEKKLIQRARSRVMAIETSDLDPDAKKQAITDVMFPMVEKMQEALKESGEAENNPYWFQVKSGARGKMSDYNAIRGASGLVNDHRNEIVPIPILHSLSEGLDPVEYWAGTYGQRRGMIAVKMSTADAGFLSKKLANAAHRIVVNKDTPPMTRLPVGLPTKVSDADNIGAVLAKDAGAHKAGDRITADILESLSEDGIEDILVHSPMTEPSEDGGVSRVAAGRRDRTELSNVGDPIGISAAQSVGAPLSQATLNEKHKSGVIGGKRNLRMGFEYLNRVIESPETFPEAGPLAEVDGVVKGIRGAPQGGKFVTVGDRDYYLHPEIEPVVKPGDTLEAGDDISDGAPHPEQLVRLRGIGEARRRYAEMLQEALTNHGIKTHRRNIETVVAGLLNWVKVTNPNGIGEHVVDDVASYNSVAGAYKARAGTKRVAPNSAVGKYLEEPVLHYTPGTRVTKKVSADLQKWGIKDVDAHDDDPDFQPVMQRGVMGVYNDNDWQTRLSGFYTSSGFLDSVHRSRVSDPNSTSYVPALAKATGFGDTLKTTGAYGTPPLPTSPPRSPR
jgi:DNA-directed RNA polymerase subunit beta'